MTGGICRSEFEARKAPHIIRRRVSYIIKGETGGQQKKVAQVFAGKTNFWQNVWERLVNVTLMLAKCNLPFRRTSEELSMDNKSNFLSNIHLLAEYRTVLDSLLQLPKGSQNILVL